MMAQKIIAVSIAVVVYVVALAGVAHAQGDSVVGKEMTISDIAQTIAIVAAAVTIITDFIQRRYQNRLTNASTYKVDADAAKTYGELTQITGERNKQLMARIDELEETLRKAQDDFARKVKEQNRAFQRQIEKKNVEIEAKNKQIASLIDEIEKRDVTIAMLSDWAERLVSQVVSLNETPVQLEQVDSSGDDDVLDDASGEI